MDFDLYRKPSNYCVHPTIAVALTGDAEHYLHRRPTPVRFGLLYKLHRPDTPI